LVGERGKVVAICSNPNVELVKSLGADEVIDYQAHAPVHQYLSQRFSETPFTTIIDAYGIQDIFSHCVDYLRSEGLFVTVGVAFKEYTVPSMLQAVCLMLKNSWWPRALWGVPREYICVNAVANLDMMERLASLVDEGALKMVVDSRWDMTDAVKAYERYLTRRAKGRVIVQIQPPPGVDSKGQTEA